MRPKGRLAENVRPLELLVNQPAAGRRHASAFFIEMETCGTGSEAVEQSNLLIVAMAERCRNIIQDKTEDTRFGLPDTLRPQHLRWMCNKIVEHAAEWSTNKSHRWIGFVQAGMIANYMLDLDGARAMFNKLREQYGAVANDQDLLDHLDPTTEFKMETGGEG